jgi:heat shock protein 1/8
MEKIKTEPAMDVSIGIDFGTCNTCVAAFVGGNLIVISDENGARTMPSCVAFTGDDDDTILVGQAAKNHIIIDPKNVVCNVKRIMGKDIKDPKVREYMQNNSANRFIENGERLLYEIEEQTYLPQQISAIILTKARRNAETFLRAHGINCHITKAVITTPTHFNYSQRTAVEEAAQIAGLKVLRMINEPTSAAIAYGFKNNLIGVDSATTAPKKLNCMVFDLGGGTFDVSFVSIDSDTVEVHAPNGNMALGGIDFDKQILNSIAAKYKINVNNKNQTYYWLLAACTKAREDLSCLEKAEMKINSDQIETVFRSQFEELCKDTFSNVRAPINSAIRDYKEIFQTLGNIDGVIMTGGGSRMPQFVNLLHQYLPNVPICTDMDPDEAIAMGAAIHAACLNQHVDLGVSDFLLIDIIPGSLAIGTANDVTTTLIKKGDPIPTGAEDIFFIRSSRAENGNLVKATDNYPANTIFYAETNKSHVDVPIEVYEGESIYCRNKKKNWHV